MRFSPVTEIFEKLKTHDIVLTPQVAGIHINYTGEHPEWAMNVNGIFNLGFCGIKRTELSMKILMWWRERLKMIALLTEVWETLQIRNGWTGYLHFWEMNTFM